MLLFSEKGYYSCQGRWSCCGENCYYFSEEEKTWNESEASCRLLGSHLAKIDNREEQVRGVSSLSVSGEVHISWAEKKIIYVSSTVFCLLNRSTCVCWHIFTCKKGQRPKKYIEENFYVMRNSPGVGVMG